jgi:DNA recombination protein RmuC
MEIGVVYLILAILVLVLALTLIIWKLSVFTRFSTRGEKDSETLRLDIKSLEEKLYQISNGLETKLADRLDKNHQSMNIGLKTQLEEGREHTSKGNQLIKDVTERLAKLEETNKQVLDISKNLEGLKSVLQNPKQRGVLGEYYLDSVLSNTLPPGGFELQYKFKNGEVVDAIIKLQGGKFLPVDSKFSLENYNRMIEEDNLEKRLVLAKEFKSDLKKRIDETSKYIRPSEGTMDFAFMFIPSEGIYYDLLVNNVGASGVQARDLIEYAYNERKVVIVSPTSFMAYLQTIIQGLRSLQIEEQAKEIIKRVQELSRHIVSHESYMQKLGNSLGTSVGHFNNAHKELKKMDKDVVKIGAESSNIDPLSIDKPNLDIDL